MRALLRSAIAGAVAAVLAAPVFAQLTTYRGTCDASAAAALDAEHFVVGSDENDVLRIYRRGHPAPVAQVDVSAFLGNAPGEESDIEAAARVGSRIYWMTSHGRSARGKARPQRQRFFATDLRPGTPPAVTPVGRPYASLLRDLASSEALARYRLAEAARFPPEANGGLNIEGLAAAPDGALLIGFRSPLAGSRALIVTLANPAEVVAGARAQLGAPIELDLGGRGVRDLLRVDDGYVIVAGPPGATGSFALYRWSGEADAPATAIAGVELGSLHPEALFAIPGTPRLQVLSDDGGVTAGGVECKSLPGDRQTFRSRIFTP